MTSPSAAASVPADVAVARTRWHVAAAMAVVRARWYVAAALLASGSVAIALAWGVGSMATLALAGAAGGVAAQAVGLGVARAGVLLVLAPLFEETLLRAGLHEALLRHAWPRWAANATSALAFGLAHALARGELAGMAVAAPALLIGAVYGRWRRLRWCVLLHAAMNAAWLAWSLVGPASRHAL